MIGRKTVTDREKNRYGNQLIGRKTVTDREKNRYDFLSEKLVKPIYSKDFQDPTKTLYIICI